MPAPPIPPAGYVFQYTLDDGATYQFDYTNQIVYIKNPAGTFVPTSGNFSIFIQQLKTQIRTDWANTSTNLTFTTPTITDNNGYADNTLTSLTIPAVSVSLNLV